MLDPLLQKTKDQAEGLFRFLFGQWRAWDKWQDIAGNNFILGKEHLEKGNLSDALFRFMLVTWFDKTHVEGWHQLGATYAAMGKRPQARRALASALKLKPGHEQAVALLKKLNEA